MPFKNPGDIIANLYNTVPNPDSRLEYFGRDSAASILRLCKRSDHSRIYIRYLDNDLLDDS